MINFKNIEKTIDQIHKFIPIRNCKFDQDIKRKMRQILQTTLINLNLVSREEFDVHTQILFRIRERLTILEQYLTELKDHNTPFKK